jgi:uncharacterized protein YjbI with pentapeptide repeats
MAKKNAGGAKPAAGSADGLKGKKFAFAEDIWLATDRSVPGFLKAFGAKHATKITADLDYLVVGSSRTGNAKAQKQAEQLNQQGTASIQIIDLEEYSKLFAPTRDELIAMLTGGEEARNRWELFCKRCSIFVPLPDLKGADLRKVDFTGVGLERVPLDGTDLGGAALSGAKLPPLKRVRLDNACLCQSELRNLEDCSLQDADLRKSQCRSTTVARCNFTKANLEDADWGGAKGARNSFREANLRRTNLEYACVEADFTGANLNEAILDKGGFHKSVFRDACLAGASLVRTDLSDADLRNADLKNAVLLGVDLSGACVDGADFTGARMDSLILGNVDPSKAKGLVLPSAAASTPKPGRSYGELERVLSASRQFKMSIDVKLGGERLQFEVEGPSWTMVRWTLGDRCGAERCQSIRNGMLDLVKPWLGGTLLPDTLKITATKASVKGHALRKLAMEAWCELFGIETPSGESLKHLKQATRAGQEEIREQLLGELRGGAKGVAQWNAHSDQEVAAAGHFRRVDLSQAKLSRAKFEHVDFSSGSFEGASLVQSKFNHTKLVEANFHAADLTQATTWGCTCTSANLEEAKLTRASLRNSSWKKASFKNADLAKADLRYCDLCGADLTGATLDGTKLEGAQYDQDTRFPEGFVPPDDMIWKGVGLAPSARKAVAEAAANAPVDVEEFMQRIQENVDQSRLSKAIQMLKADRFQLFADVQDEHLVGVVKSQSDPELVYSCRLNADGSFACCTQNLNVCGGLRGALCKHLLVLIIGLAKGNQLDPSRVHTWIEASRHQKPVLDKEAMSQTFLRYKGAEAGEIDWRPTETIPEDYYTL